MIVSSSTMHYDIVGNNMVVPTISYGLVGIFNDVHTISCMIVGIGRSEKGTPSEGGQKKVLPPFLGQKTMGSLDGSPFIYSARSDCRSSYGRYVTAFLEEFSMLNHTISLWVKEELIDVVSSNVKSSGLLVNTVSPEKDDLLGHYTAIEIYSIDMIRVSLFYKGEEVKDVRVDVSIGKDELTEIVGDVARWIGWSD